MKTFTRKARLNRIIDFTAAIHKLPADLYDIYETQDGGRVMPYYMGDGVNNQFYASRLLVQDKLLREINKFIKLAYGTESEYFTSVGKIILHRPVHETEDALLYDEANLLWRKGRRDLIVLIADILAEETERAKLDEDQSQALRYAGFLTVFLISLLTIWFAPKELFSVVFNPETLLAARVCLSLTIATMSMVILAPNKWKELIGISLIPFIIALVPLLKTDKDQEIKQVPVDRQIIADTTKNINVQKALKRPQVLLSDSLEKP